MMDIDRVIELMGIEQRCVIRADSCDRDCAKCDLVQDEGELIRAYDKVIEWLLVFKQRIVDHE